MRGTAAFTQNLYRGGGNYTSTGPTTGANSRAPISLPQSDLQLRASRLNVTQPLLRGFKIDATRAALQTNRISQQNDEIALQSTMATTQANTRNAYWDLVFAIQAVEAAQNSLDISTSSCRTTRRASKSARWRRSTSSRRRPKQANRRLTLVQAQATVRTSELALKRLIVSGTDDPLWTSSINPVDRPAATPEPINVDAAVTRALKERTDMQQSLNNLQISDINLQNQVDQTQAAAEPDVQLRLTGLGGRHVGGARSDHQRHLGSPDPVGLPRRAPEHLRLRRAAVDARRRRSPTARPAARRRRPSPARAWRSTRRRRT